MKIPIQNIYYILSYAWNKLQESKIVNVSGEDYERIYDLLSQVLINGCHHLFKRGLDRNYINAEEAYPGIKGKILFGECLKNNLLRQGKAFCSFDEFHHDVLHNQIIKATLKRLTKIRDLDINLKKKVWKTYWRFENIAEIELDLRKFQSVKIHRNNYFYDFLTKICKLIVINTALNEKDGNYVFKDFIKNDTLMRPVFEGFVRNFYALEAPQYKVRREDIYWAASPIEESDYSYLPKMQTDISLESSDRKIIIDTKFSAKTLSHHHKSQSEKVKSENLYQIYSYLRNIELKEKHPLNSHSEGILLYPTVIKPFDQSFQMGNHRLRISTVDLAANWKNIHKRLLHLVE